jgi:transcriptional regulator with XRE-family HTH domain
MKITGTQAAFLAMLEERGVYAKLGVSRSTVSNWKRSIEGNGDQQPPTIDKMEEMLQKYGATVVKDKVWKIPQ